MIGIVLNDNLFENDIRALLMAFYPGEKIVRDTREGDKTVEVIYRERTITANISEKAAESGDTLIRTCKAERELYVKNRNILKRLIYILLHEKTGKILPWGTLTGIRPTKIAMDLLQKNYSEADLYQYFKDEYYISDEKYQLCTQVARNEKRILSPYNLEAGYSLYVGIPFCPTICAYCSFSSYPLKQWEKQVDTYLDALFIEIEAVSKLLHNKTPLTVYFGGGTPTSLKPHQLERLIVKLKQCFEFSGCAEFTVEAGRPDSITAAKLEVLRRQQVDRISINPQTMNQKTLDTIGRRHTVDEIIETYHLARSMGFDNINMDLIMGLPDETPEDVEYTFEEIKKLNPDSLTVHSLAIKRAARLNQERSAPIADAFAANEMIHRSYQTAAEMEMEPYYLYRQKNIAGNLENVGYARRGKEGLYNILIMEERQSIIALGASGSSKIVFPGYTRIERIENVKSVKDYIERIDEMIGRKQAFFALHPETLK